MSSYPSTLLGKAHKNCSARERALTFNLMSAMCRS